MSTITSAEALRQYGEDVACQVQDEVDLILQIATRASAIQQRCTGHPLDPLDILRSLYRFHAHRPLDLDKLVAAHDTELAYDVFGLHNRVPDFTPKFLKESA